MFASCPSRILHCAENVTVWEVAHETALNHVDVSAHSRTLVTTRIKGLLAGAGQVELGLPSTESALQILLASAGLEQLASTPPVEAAEVVEICGKLPLTLAICGKLIKDYGLSEDDSWDGVAQHLKEQLVTANGSEGESETLAYRIIELSLNSIHARDQAACRHIFTVMSTVAEDTMVPPQAFRIMLSAVNGTTELVPEMRLRSWLQLLINRSLLLGSWERPQLHGVSGLASFVFCNCCLV